MTNRGTRGAYRKEDRVSLPPQLQKEVVEKAAARYGNCQELAKHLNIPKSSVHYYRIGRLTMPVSVLEQMLKISGDANLEERVRKAGIEKDRTWANEYAISVYREMCREKLHLPTREELEKNDNLRRKAAAIVSYVMAEGSVWLQKEKWGECAMNITFGKHETDLYDHFRGLFKDVFLHDIGPAQEPGNGAIAIRGFSYSRFIAEWFIENGMHPGEKSGRNLHLPDWVMNSNDEQTWISALQPWCDGEGCVHRSNASKSRGFIIAQSRHSDLDIHIVPRELASRAKRTVGRGVLSDTHVFGIPVLEYCASLFRSSVLDEVGDLFIRLGFEPRIGLACLRYKDNGLWSCIWTMRFGCSDSHELLRRGLITQSRKKEAMTSH